MDAFETIYDNNIQALREYLELGDINVLNDRGMSLLHTAIVFSNSDIFNLLLENYINVNLKDKQGCTPAHLCVSYNRLGFLKMLIRHNADLKIKNNDGQTPLYKACLLGKENMIALLLESLSFDLYEEDNNEETIFMGLVRSRNLNLLNKVIVDKDIIDKPNFKGEAPIHIAAKSGDVKVLDYLITHGAFVNLKTNQGETPLFYAIKARSYDCVDLLLQHGAILDCKNKSGEKAIDLIEADSMIDFINEKSIKYKYEQYKISFPLHYAILIEDYSLVKQNLVIRNIHREDPYGFTPTMLTSHIKNEKISKLLSEFN